MNRQMHSTRAHVAVIKNSPVFNVLVRFIAWEECWADHPRPENSGRYSKAGWDWPCASSASLKRPLNKGLACRRSLVFALGADIHARGGNGGLRFLGF